MALHQNEIKQYWQNRYKDQGLQTVGFIGRTKDQQDRDYKANQKVIFQHVPTDLATLDYGCGVGRHCKQFTGSYLGVDVTDQHIQAAKKLHPLRTFIHLRNPYLTKTALRGFDFELFFTANVLQHCADDVVLKVLKTAYRINNTARFALYENEQVQKSHVKGRKPEQYKDMIKEAGYKIDSFIHYPHVGVMGEKHNIIMVWTR